VYFFLFTDLDLAKTLQLELAMSFSYRKLCPQICEVAAVSRQSAPSDAASDAFCFVLAQWCCTCSVVATVNQLFYICWVHVSLMSKFCVAL